MSSPHFWEANSTDLNLHFTMLVEAARSEFEVEPGIKIPLSRGVHLLNTKFLYLFHNFDELNTKLCLLVSRLTRGRSSMAIAPLLLTLSRSNREIGEWCFSILKSSIKV